MFSREFCGISKNTFFTEHLLTTASPKNLSFSFFRIMETAVLICSAKKAFLNDFTKFTEKHLCRSPFSINLHSCNPWHSFKGVIMRNLCGTIFLHKDECITRFSYLHECTFNTGISHRPRKTTHRSNTPPSPAHNRTSHRQKTDTPAYNQKHADTPNQTKRYTRAYIKTHIQIQENGKLKVQLQTWKESLFSANHGAAICAILENAVF